MEENWEVYCLMSALIYIEEISKPTEHLQVKTNKSKSKQYECLGFHSIRLKMKDEEVVNKIFDITKKWERRKNTRFIGPSFVKVRKENSSQQDVFFFSPLWLNTILAECGKIPNDYSFKTALKRINHFKRYTKIPIDSNKKLFNSLLENKYLAAGAFIVSMDMEFRGIQSGRLSLCMSEKYKDFLNLMLKVAKKWGWTHNKQLSSVNVEYSKKLGIRASPQYELRIHVKGMQEIYQLAGPLLNSHKDKCISFHVQRSKKYINKQKITGDIQYEITNC